MSVLHGQQFEDALARVGHELSQPRRFGAPGVQRGQDRPLFHGTATDFGHQVVMPSEALPQRSKWKDYYDTPGEEWRKRRVFATGNERSAWQWAQGKGRLRVHEVSMSDPHTTLKDDPTGEWHGRSALVQRTHWAPPPNPYQPNASVQPALSPLNWEEHGAPNWSERTGEAHPTPLSRQFSGLTADERADRAGAAVRRQEALNNRGRQRSLF